MLGGSTLRASSAATCREERSQTLPPIGPSHMIRSPMPGPWRAVSNPMEASMATSRSWHQVKGRWTRSLGMRGLRVRLFQMRRGGKYYRDIWLPGRGKNRKSLGTTERGEGERLGQILLAQLIKAAPANGVSEAILTLGDLWQ